jgi:hypothetical protein
VVKSYDSKVCAETCWLCLPSCRCQPAQLWGVLWGFAQSGCPPEEPWLASWLAAAQQQLDGFDAEGLAHSIWALAALGHVPHKLWLRAYCGMVAYKIKWVTGCETHVTCFHADTCAWLSGARVHVQVV